MAIQGTDISIVYSGGGSNADPSLSLGGDPSSIPITGVLNNLFSNVSTTDSEDGSIDYRCVYMFNDNETDSLFETKLFILSQVAGGADIQVGCTFANDQQKVTITGTVTGGTCTLGYAPDGVTVTDTAIMTAEGGLAGISVSLQEALNDIPALVGATCTQVTMPGKIEILITFGGNAGNRFLTLLKVTDNAFLGTTVDVSMIKVVNGAPINQIASPISSSIIAPAGVTFSSPSESSPISIGKIGPTEGFPVWVKRVVAQNTPGLSDDGATIRLKGKPFV